MKFRRFASAFLAVVMVGVNVFNGLLPVLADAEDPTVHNSGPTELDDGVKLYKTVKSVPGYANKWEVTLRIESPKTEKTSDTVIVIDRSGSMSNNNRLTEAKAAARSLAQSLLPDGNTTNRVAVVSFASSASNSGTGTDFTDDYDTVSSAIGRMSASGGTYTQSAIHMAAEMLSNSTADLKTMILLSDGEPTYSVSFTDAAKNDNNNFVAYGNALETSSEVSQSVFNYTDTGKVGDGNSLRQCMQRDRYGNCIKYYNNGNSAIAEAGYYKATGNNLYAIGLEVVDNPNRTDDGADVLGAIASPGKYYGNVSPADLTTIFNEIGGNILSLVQNASVMDEMGQGVKVSVTGGDVLGQGLEMDENGDLDWVPEFKLEGNIFVAETSYIVEMNEDVYNQTPDEDEEEDGFYALNKKATLTYDGGGGEFPIPEAKPFALRVEKELAEVDENGVSKPKTGEEFKFQISGNDKEYSVLAGGNNYIRVPMPIKLGTEYTITETGVGDDNEIAFEYYNTPEYTVKYNGVESATNKFTVTAEHGDEIDVKIKNTYEKTSITASKVWDDGGDRDGLRSKYGDLYVAVKDGNNYVGIGAISTEISDEPQSFTFSNLPKNRNGKAINYTVVEARGCSESKGQLSCQSEFTGDTKYAVTIDGNNQITNKHVPETTKLTIKKKWDISAGTLPSVTPGFVTVKVSNDKNSNTETITLRGSDYAEWEGEFEGYKYENGQEIHYSIVEEKIGNNTFADNESTLYIYKDKVLEGKWVASYNNMEVTNTWTPAKTVYTGNGEFYIKKLDQDGKTLQGVTFTVGNDTYTTGADGKVVVEFSADGEEPDDKYTLNIKETSAPDYYALISGTEVIEATTNLNLTVDEQKLTNTYVKSFDLAVKTAVNGYVWQADDNTLVVTNQALAKGLKIEKTFEGISAEAFESNSQIIFTITGPKGFDTMTVGIGDDECEVSGSKLVCEISGKNTVLPIGSYTVSESNAEITNFTYVGDPEDGKVSQTVKLGETATFELKNTYTPVDSASYKVKKEWKDDGDRDGIRPDDLEVTLYADGKKYGPSVNLNDSNEWVYEWTNLPLVNEDAETVQYTAKEADIDDYDSDGGVMIDGVFVFTNTHDPELYEKTGELLVEKVWSGEDNELARPATITVVLYGEITDDEGNTKTWVVGNPVEISSADEWKWTFKGLYKYENGKEIAYSVQESAIGGTNFSEGESTIVVYEDDGQALKGKWEKTVSDYEITNTWTPATNVYNGKDEFSIKKIDQNGDVMEGVTFVVEAEEYTTDENGLIKIVVPEATNIKEDDLEYVIEEVDTLKGYNLVDGSATVWVRSVSEFEKADIEKLENTYNKVYSFSADDVDGYTWNENEKTMTVVNERSKAKSLKIEKRFSGISESALQGVTFIITGPEDFGEDGGITLILGDDCTISDSVAICNVDVDIPTGEYTVKEDNAEIEGYTLTVSGDDGETKEVEKDDEVVFEIINEYEEIPEPEDPCANDGGCGGQPFVPTAPDTGSFTNVKNDNNDKLSGWIGGVAAVVLTVTSVTMLGVESIVRRK